MSRYYSRRNKRKNWRSTYGVPFVRRRELKMAHAFAHFGVAAAQAQIISAATAYNPFAAINKCMDIAALPMQMAKHLQRVNINEGFASC